MHQKQPPANVATATAFVAVHDKITGKSSNGSGRGFDLTDVFSLLEQDEDAKLRQVNTHDFSITCLQSLTQAVVPFASLHLCSENEFYGLFDRLDLRVSEIDQRRMFCYVDSDNSLYVSLEEWLESWDWLEQELHREVAEMLEIG